MVILHVCEALYVIVLQSLTKCWNMALKIELPSPSHLTMLVWKIQMKRRLCVNQRNEISTLLEEGSRKGWWRFNYCGSLTGRFVGARAMKTMREEWGEERRRELLSYLPMPLPAHHECTKTYLFLIKKCSTTLYTANCLEHEISMAVFLYLNTSWCF